MSDERVRGAERAASQGDVATEARFLLERLRAGAITREALELAAYCGHAAAREVVPSAPEPPPQPSSWIMGLARFGRPTWPRALTWAAELVLDQPGDFGHEATTPAQAAAARALALTIHACLDRPDPTALRQADADVNALEALFEHPEYHVARSLLVLDAYAALTVPAEVVAQQGHFMGTCCGADNPEAVHAVGVIARHLRERFLAHVGLVSVR